ncbi:PKD domain-containing protein [Janthinobacterium sp. Mn2066]|uniref:PKD domain-containing protein n=1 Tax=Janthinobacterium sp. Mn2066 TaxID=3395264 RepID=UPI003BC11216
MPQAPSHPSRFVRPALPLSLILVAVLTACGGGGGGASDPAFPGTPPPVTPPVTPPASNANTPLLLTSSNARSAPPQAFGYGVVTLGMAQTVVDWSAGFSDSATLPKACSNGGSQSATFTDADGSHGVSAGDKLSVTYVNCYLKEVDVTLDGTINVAYATPPNGQQLSGTISFAPGFAESSGGARQNLSGNVRFDYANVNLSKLLRTYSDSQPLVISVTDSASKTTRSDTVTLLEAQHELRIDTARATTSLRYHLASEILGGSLDISTTTPWTSWFDTLPDAGELLLTGASDSKAGLRVRPVADSSDLDVVLGNTPLTSIPAAAASYLWSSGAWLPQNAGLAKYDIKPATQSGLSLLIAPDLTNVAPGTGSLSWVYSRPLQTLPVGNVFFRPQDGSFGTIAANVSYQGAILIVRPASQFVPGVTYQLSFDDSATYPLRDATGNSISPPGGAVQVKQSIRAVIGTNNAAPLLLGAGASLTLDASASSANGQPVNSIRWRQISGPTLTLDSTTAARITVTGPASSKGVSTIELQVSNAAGETDTQQLAIQVLTDFSQALLYTYRIGKGDLVIESDASATEFAYARYYSDNTTEIMSSRERNFLITLPGNQTWQAGLTASYGPGNTSGVTGYGWVGDDDCKGKSTGSFIVREYTFDSNGQPASIAIDVDDNCAGVTTQASIRYRSKVPVRP